jgi:hypothetical protein
MTYQSNPLLKYLNPAFFLLLLALAQTGLAQNSGKDALDLDAKQLKKARNSFKWEAMSQVKADTLSIDSVHLTGNWKAFYGLFNFNGMVNSMNLFQPFVIQVQGTSIKRSENAPLVPYTLFYNKLLIGGKEPEEGFINLLTNKLLVITWKQDTNYTRYYYERADE